MAKKKSTSKLAVMVSALVLLFVFVAAIFYIERETQVIVASESDGYGNLEMIPTLSTSESGSVDMKLRYITIRENVNVFDYIYENQETAVSDFDHTALYLLERVNSTNATHTYQISKIENATFLRILVMQKELLDQITIPQNLIVQDDQGRYSAQVITEDSQVYLNLTRSDDEL